MALTLVISIYAGNNIFLANSPNLNPNYLADLKTKFNKNLNSIYLALNSWQNHGFDQKNTKQKITPTPPSYLGNNMNFTKITPTSGQNRFDPASIPANLFKPLAKGVYAYDSGNGNNILKIDNGTAYKVKQLKLSDGTVVNIIDLSGR